MLSRPSILICFAAVVMILSACVVPEELSTSTAPVSPLRVEKQQGAAETTPPSSPLPTPTPPKITPIVEEPGNLQDDTESTEEMNDEEKQTVAVAKQALAERMKVTTDQIELISVKSVQFRDSSLGCPQKGMVYLQVITPGYQVMLSLEGQTYDYRVAGQKTILCGD